MSGLLATQGIRGGANRRVLERIKETGDIFLAWSDEPWVLDGAAVHITSSATTTVRSRSASSTASRSRAINANLTSGIDLTRARRLPREPRHRLHGRHEGRPVRHPRRGRRSARWPARIPTAARTPTSFAHG